MDLREERLIMKFQYFDGPQRSPEWYKLRLGRPTASRLDDWTAVSVAKGKEGTPLKSRTDYERELMFEKKFGVAFERYVNSAMEDGVNYEAFALKQYQAVTGNIVNEVGAWFNEWFLASPDGGVGDEGVVEAKVLKDNKFSEVLYDGVPTEHWKQIQGQLFASKRKWGDYVAINFTTKKIKIIRVLPDKEFFKELETRLKEPLSVEDFTDEGVYDFRELPFEGPTMVQQEANINLNF
jgi:hypothetical protein